VSRWAFSLFAKLLHKRELSALGVFALKEALPIACKKFLLGVSVVKPFFAKARRKTRIGN
jgi:hypothetical protein